MTSRRQTPEQGARCAEATIIKAVPVTHDLVEHKKYFGIFIGGYIDGKHSGYFVRHMIYRKFAAIDFCSRRRVIAGGNALCINVSRKEMKVGFHL